MDETFTNQVADALKLLAESGRLELKIEENGYSERRTWTLYLDGETLVDDFVYATKVY